MRVLFLKQWVSGEMIRAVSWTFLHSFWQGLIAALIAGSIILCTRNSTARLRYNLLGGVFVLFLGTTIITLFLELSGNNTFSAALPFSVNPDGIVIYNSTDVQTAEPVAGFIDQFVNYLNNNAGLAVLIWLIVFIAKSVKMTAGLYYINKIRSIGIHQPADKWNKKMLELGESLGLRQPVPLFESALIKVPAAIGFIKPVILVPLGLLANLPAEHVETILLHELSHIRRRDYLINLFQNVAETIFFFNPALIWISSLIREEREACCDDIVVANTAHKIRYLEALVSFQEHYINSASAGYAMSFGNKKMHMLNRLNRLITNQNKKLNFMEKIILLSGLVIITAFNFIPKNGIISSHEPILKKGINQNFENIVRHENIPENKDNKAVQSKTAIQPLLPGEAVSGIPREKKYKIKQNRQYAGADTIPGHVFTSIRFYPSNDEETRDQLIIATSQSGTRYIVTKTDGKVTAMSIDGVSITDLSLPENIKVLKQIEDVWNEARRTKDQRLESENIEMDKRIPEEPADKFNYARKEKFSQKEELLHQKQDQFYKKESPLYKEKEQQLYSNESPLYKGRKQQFYSKKSPLYKVKKQHLYKKEAPLYKKKEPLYKKEAPLYKKEEQLYKKEKPLNMNERQLYKEELSLRQEKLSHQKAEDRQFPAKSGSIDQNNTTDAKMEAKRIFEQKNQENQNRDMERAHGVIRDLVREQVVPDAASVEWFGLSETELIVNGKKLDAALQQKLKTKYNVAQDFGLFYGPVKMTGTGVFLDK